MKTKRQIILETATYYGADPSRRGLDANVRNTCTYVNDAGQMCAIGRLLTDEGLKVYHGDISTPASDIEPEYIQPEYRDALSDDVFAEELQHFHDHQDFWNDEGLTELGKKSV